MQLPPSIGKLRSLRKLSIGANELRALPKEICDLPLEELDLSCNRDLPPEATFELLAGLPALTRLDWTDGNIKALPDSLGRLRSLTMLNLNANPFRSFPDAIGRLQQLSELRLSSDDVPEHVASKVRSLLPNTKVRLLGRFESGDH
jgi:Leucine-rich repeat (LRR) protein